ncbi:MAG: hypothetical protein ACRDZ3_22325 [Acidimicrobiia bacterium]
MVFFRLVIVCAALGVFMVMTRGSHGGGGATADAPRTLPAEPAAVDTAVLLPGPPRRPVVPAEIAGTAPTVVIRDARLRPDVVAVPAWRAVTLTVESADPSRSHSLRLALPGPDPVARFAGAGRAELRFRAPGAGTYRMACEIHRSMRGTVHVIR